MKTFTDIKGIIFDYGGTIDTNSRHWAEVLWGVYTQFQVPVDKQSFCDAFVHGERTLAKFPLIKEEHNFHDVLTIKLKIQIDYLIEQGKLQAEAETQHHYAQHIADEAYAYVLRILEKTRPVVKELAKRFKLVLVSNFYGNIHTILRDFDLEDCFTEVIESAVVGVRKPDSAIYQLGVDAMGYSAQEIVVVGDSFSKDVVPAKHVGCKVVWLKGEGWGGEVIDEALPDVIITDLCMLPLYF